MGAILGLISIVVYRIVVSIVVSFLFVVLINTSYVPPPVLLLLLVLLFAQQVGDHSEVLYEGSGCGPGRRVCHTVDKG